MSGDRLDVTVTFDPRHGYIASGPELRQPIVALSLGRLRRRIELAMLDGSAPVNGFDGLPGNIHIVLQLDGLAERERHRRRAQAQLAR